MWLSDALVVWHLLASVGVVRRGKKLVFIAMAETHILQRHRSRYIGRITDRPFAQLKWLLGKFQCQLACRFASFLGQHNADHTIGSVGAC